MSRTQKRREDLPWITVMVEARIEDVLNTLRAMPPKLVDERLVCELHRETRRLLRHQQPGEYE